MAEAKKKVEEKEEEKKATYATIVCNYLPYVMEDPKAMVNLEQATDQYVQNVVHFKGVQDEGVTTTLALRDKYRRQLQIARGALESLEARLMHMITG